jgi:hypothetical protein
MSSENNALTIPVHYGASYRVAHLLAKESKPFSRQGIRNKIFAKHNARDMSEKSNCFQYFTNKSAPCNNDVMS